MPGERDRVESAVRSGPVQQSALALGLMLISKWDRANGKYGTASSEQAAEFDNFTPAEVQKFWGEASNLLDDYAKIVADSQKPSFWMPVWQGFIAAFLYSLFLVVIYLLVKHGGHDLLEIARDALEKRQ